MATWTLIASLDAPSGGVFDFPSLSLGAYSLIQVIGSGITVTTDGTDVRITVYASGSEITAGNTYQWGAHLDTSGGSGNTDNDNAANTMYLMSNDLNWDVGNAASEGFGFVATFDGPASSSLKKRMRYESALTNPSGNVIGAEGIADQTGTAAIDGLKVTADSSLTAGKVRIVGMA